MTNCLNFKLSTDVEKNPGPTQNNTDSSLNVSIQIVKSNLGFSPILLLIWSRNKIACPQ